VIGRKRRTRLHDGVLLGVELLVLLQRHAHAGDDEQRAEDVDDPLESGQQRRARADEQAAHHERAENPPEQHAVLVLAPERRSTERSAR
jgi:hypothetical protein